MRWRLAQLAALAVTCLFAGYSRGQTVPTATCPAASGHDEQSGPEISIVEVSFSGFLRMPVSEQNQIAASIEQSTHGNVLDDGMDEALERARAGWQNRGYFKVEVRGDAKTPTSGPVSQRIALSVHVDEGLRYTLSRITFKNNKAISNVRALRSLFPIQDGEIFSRETIGVGLENLRNAYGQFGYINFTSVPDTKTSDEDRHIALIVDMDEGKQFYVSRVEVLGLDEPTRQDR